MNFKHLYRRFFIWCWERYKLSSGEKRLDFPLLIEMSLITESFIDWEFEIREYNKPKYQFTSTHPSLSDLITSMDFLIIAIRERDYLPDYFKNLVYKKSEVSLVDWLTTPDQYIVSPLSAIGLLIERMQSVVTELTRLEVLDKEEIVYYRSRMSPLVVDVKNLLSVLLLISLGK